MSLDIFFTVIFFTLTKKIKLFKCNTCQFGYIYSSGTMMPLGLECQNYSIPTNVIKKNLKIFQKYNN